MLYYCLPLLILCKRKWTRETTQLNVEYRRSFMREIRSSVPGHLRSEAAFQWSVRVYKYASQSHLVFSTLCVTRQK